MIFDTCLYAVRDAVYVAETLRDLNKTSPQGLLLVLGRTRTQLDALDELYVDWKATDPLTHATTNLLSTSSTARYIVLAVTDDSVNGQQVHIFRQDVDAA